MEASVLIKDTRQSKDFLYTTFGNFKLSDVKKELLKSLHNSKIEAGCFWTAEMICSGHLEDLWDLFILFYSKTIQLGNVKLVLFLSKRLEYFKKIASHEDSDFSFRNLKNIRILFAEVVGLLCLSKKKNSFNPIEIKTETFDMTEIKENLKAPNLDFCKDSFRKDEDSNELIIPLNEFCYSLSMKNTLQCFYWVEWLLEYETRCTKKREKLKIDRRSELCPIQKFQKDMVWVLWDCINKEIDKVEKNKSFLTEIFKGTINLFLLNYNTSRGKKKKFLLFFFCSILTEPFDVTTPILDKDHQEIIDNVKENIDSVYKQIKKNEIFSHLDYLQIIPLTKEEKIKQQMEKIFEN
jgi:hypothetical protein